MKKRVEIVRTFPDSILRTKTNIVKEISGSVIKTLDQMIKVVRMADAAGLAANQIGISNSLAVALLKNDEFLKLINPVMIEKEGEEIDEEGCLSIPDVILNIQRAKKIIIEYLDINGNKKIFEASGFTARVLQHEIDHLNGTLIIDKLKPQEKLKFLRKYKK
jgi:peptide deformylase